MRVHVLPLLLYLVALLTLPGALAQGDRGDHTLPSEGPILRIEYGFHSAPITSIDSSDDGTLVTASLDKTVRVWRKAGNGVQLLSTYRIPLNNDSAFLGKLFSCAISPDGRWIAVGGATRIGGGTRLDGKGGAAVYIIDRRLGTMQATVSNLDNFIYKLAFSPDGKRLLICLAKRDGDPVAAQSGVRVASVPDGKVLWSSEPYGASSHGASWLPDGSGFITTCYDGMLRRYKATGPTSYTLDQAPLAVGNNLRPYRIAIRGDYLICGFSDEFGLTPPGEEHPSCRLLNMNWRTWTRQKDIRIEYFNNGNLQSVGFMDDKWFAGGHFLLPKTGQYLVSMGSAQEDAVTIHDDGLRETIADMVSIRNQTMAIVTGDPSIGLYTADGTRSESRGILANMRDKHEVGFQVSEDGSRVWFGLEKADGSPVTLDISRASISYEETPARDLHPPHSYAGALAITGLGEETGTVNGQPTIFRRTQKLRAADWAPGGRRIFVAGDRAIYAEDLDRPGARQALWEIPTPASCWGVNVTAGGRLLVAVFGDGSIRWYNAATGTELLSAFVTQREVRRVYTGSRSRSNSGFVESLGPSRWVAWTPKGYYMAGPGGESLIGWHVNRGADQLAQWYPASRFRDRFNQPKVVQTVLSTMDEEAAIQGAMQQEVAQALVEALPPVVKILSPEDVSEIDSNKVRIRYRIETPSDAPIGKPSIRVNGGLARAFSFVGDEDTEDSKVLEFDQEVEVPSSDCSVTIRVSNKNGTSEPATVNFRWVGKESAVNAGMASRRCFVLSIGVGSYAAPIPTLKWTKKDASNVVDAFKRQEGKYYSEVQTRLLDDATKQEVEEGFAWLLANATPSDMVVIFLAGHGDSDDNSRYFFITSDVRITPDMSKSERYKNAVDMSIIAETVSKLPCKCVVFIDTCEAASSKNEFVLRTQNLSTTINTISDSQSGGGGYVFCSSAAGQSALENDKWENGAFTKALCEILNGNSSDLKDEALKGLLGISTIRTDLLRLYLSERVITLTDMKQTPEVTSPSGVSANYIVGVR